MPLSERLRPHRLDGLVGNPRARQELGRWADEWTVGDVPARRAAILVGPPGVGKTSAAVALAEERGWTLVEMNASDARNQASIERVAGRASVSHTLTEPAAAAGHALILLDEADCLTGRVSESGRAAPEPPPLREFLRGRYGTIAALNAAWGLPAPPRTKAFADWAAVPASPGNFAWGRLVAARKDLEEWRASGKTADTSDRGGLGAIARLVRSTRQPIVLTVNDDRPLTRYSAVFRTAALRVRFYPIRPDEISRRLTDIVRAESIPVGPRTIPAIVARAQGDLRAALNDLEAVGPLPPGDAQLEVLGGRDRTADFAGLVAESLTSARFYRGGEVRDRLDAPPDDLLPWVEENVPLFAPSAAHRAAAFRTLGVADLFLCRARRYRTYGLWSYASELLTGGVGLAIRDRAVPASGEAAFPQFLGEMGRSRSMRAVRDAVVAKAGRRFHLSRQKVRAVMLPALEGIVGTARRHRGAAEARARQIVRELQLTPEEVAYLLVTTPDDPTVARLAEPSADLESPATATAEAPREAPPRASPSKEPPASEPPRKRQAQRRLGEFPP